LAERFRLFERRIGRESVAGTARQIADPWILMVQRVAASVRGGPGKADAYAADIVFVIQEAVKY
jgi:hypothetical protein